MQEDFGGYKRDDVPELEEHLRTRRVHLDSFKEGYKEKHPEVYQAFETFLDAVDWDMLYLIFKEYLSTSNVSGEKLNRINREDIHIVPSEKNDPIARFSTMYNDIFFFDAELPEVTKNKKGEPVFEERDATHLFLTLVHEMVHSVGHVRVSFQKQPDGTYESGVVSGIWRGTEHILESLNEAITERVAQEIVFLYFSRKGMDRGVLDNAMRPRLDYKEGSYASHIAFLEGICEKVDGSIGIEAGATWKSLKRGYFGEDIHDPIVTEAFSEIFDKKFLKKYSALKGIETKKRVRLFGRRYGLLHRRQSIARWRKYLQSLS